MPRAKRQHNPWIRKYLKTSAPAADEGARSPGEPKPVRPTAWQDGKPFLDDGQVYVTKYGSRYHTVWCPVVADAWENTPRALLVTLLADVGGRGRCRDCERPVDMQASPEGQFPESQAPSGQESRLSAMPPSPEAPADMVIPLKVVGLAHGVLFLAAGREHRERLRQTAVEPATPLSVGGRRDGLVLRVDAAREEPLLVVQLDPRVTFQNVPYQVRLRRPLLRSATKPYAVAVVEPAYSE